jgi:hypothetical protein
MAFIGCPFCAKTVNSDDRICQHCGADIAAYRDRTKQGAEATPTIEADPNAPLSNVTAAVPANIRGQLLESEAVHHFGYIDSQGGCGSTKTSKQWLFVSSTRIVYEATVRENSSYIQTCGSIPLSKVGFVGTSTAQRSDGCSAKNVHFVRVGSGGGVIEIAIPTAPEAKCSVSQLR